jgi:hypothetical protein
MQWVSKTATTLCLALCAGLTTGCVDDESSLFVVGAFNLEATDCLVKPSLSAELRFQGVLDLEFSTEYHAALLVGSQLTQQGSREKIRTETSRLRLRGADVTLFRPDQSEVSFTTSASGFVDPASGTAPGLAAIATQLIRSDDYPDHDLLGLAIARVRVFGQTLGGQDIESGDFDFPIEICKGCLVTYPAAAFDTGSATDGTCLANASIEDPTVCFPGQDASFPCTSSICASKDVCTSPRNNDFYKNSQ